MEPRRRHQRHQPRDELQRLEQQRRRAVGIGFWRPPDRKLLELRLYLPMVRKGTQIGLQMALEVWLFTATSLTMIRMGVVEMGGHAVALNLASVAFMIPTGIGAAAATRVGNAIGREVRPAQGSRRGSPSSSARA